MMYDIAALQYLYGANYNTNNTDTVYKWNPATGQETINGVAQAAPGGNTIFMTIWDGGGNDTYDFSNYTTNVTVNLQPGSWTTTSTAQLANLGGGHYGDRQHRQRLSLQQQPGLADRERGRRHRRRRHHRQHRQQQAHRRGRQRHARRRQRHRHRRLFRALRAPTR